MSIRGRISITLLMATVGVSAAVAITLPGGAGAQSAHDATAGPAITEYALPRNAPAPEAIAAGPASLWYAQAATPALGIRNSNGSYGQKTGLSAPVTGIVVAGHDDVWFTEAAGNGAIGHVAPDGTVTEFTAGLTAGSAPTGITAGPDGNVWFTESAGNGAIGRITPSGTITQYTAGLTPGSQPQAIAAGPDGNLWFTESGGNGAIGRITPGGAITEYPTPTTGSQPQGITAGPDGNLWFTESGGNGAIGRITPSGTVTEYPTPTTGSRPQGIAIGPDGNLWFTESGGNGAIGRITPAGTITEYPTPTAGSRPDGISLDGDNTLWVAETGAVRIASVALPSPPTATTTATTTTTAPVTSAPSGLPATGTGGATQIGSHEATVTGTVDPSAGHTTYHFDFGTTTAYGQQAPAADAAVGSASGRVLSKTLTGLRPDTVYHYRIVATDCGGCQGGTSYGNDMTFETLVDGSQSGDGSPEAPSVAGKTAVAGLVAGTVLVRTPHSSRLVALTRNSTIPVGSLVDATHGTVSVTTALGHGGRVQSVTAWGGSFTVHQRAGHGMTTLALAGRLACSAPSHATMRTMFARRSARRAPRRSLWAHDNHGQYSTRGRNSVATVRGTVWETVDTCAGTLTYVKRGVVSVRDLRRHRTVLVRAGHRYLARG